MQHELFHSDFKPSIERSSLLDIIRDSPLGENPHRAVAMRLVFERSIRDCRERMLVQEKKPLQADPAAKPDSSGKVTSTPTSATHPTTTQPPPPATEFKLTAERSPSPAMEFKPATKRPRQPQASVKSSGGVEAWFQEFLTTTKSPPTTVTTPKGTTAYPPVQPFPKPPQSSTSRTTSTFDDPRLVTPKSS